MNMRKILYALVSVLVLFSCQNANQTKISGQLDNSGNEKVYLQELTLTGNNFQDSAILSGSGKFKFNVKLSQPSFYKLIIGNQRGITLIAKPKDNVQISGDAKKIYETYTVKGSEESAYAQALDKRMDRTIRGLDSLNAVYKQFLDNPNIVNITRTLQNNYDRFIEEQRKFTIDFIQKHPSSLASIMALYQQTDENVFVLSKTEDTKYYSLVDSLVYRQFPKASYVMALHNNLDNIKAEQKKVEIQKIMSALGATAQNFTLPDLSGKNISISSFKGNPAVLYFWASWCDSCRTNNASLNNIYNKYKSKGLKIVAVSLDMNKDSWKAAIQKDGITNWTHVSDLKYWNSPIVPLYNIENLPAYFLIDQEGTIISRSVNEMAIDERLELLLK